ncbi:hypothetical protein [Pseudonocardia acaciae]|uniref:hypothetical protein n=1 Tax=Pseudonocardia acaciae TaxID=551276 RepID=UPI000564214F|nr:hypothetical protein [Pseudonocardia acaciae]
MDLPLGLHGTYLQRDLIERVGRYPVRAALLHGALVRLWRRVLVDAERATEVRTRAAAALLLHGRGSVLAGPTAAGLHGCTAIDDADVHVLVPYGHPARTRTGLVVHNGSIPPTDVIEIDGLPVLGAERVTCDLLCTARPRDAIAVTDQMLVAQPPERREVFRARVGQRLKSRPDPRGTRRGARLLGLASGRAESPPESWLLLEVVDLGFPPPEANWPVLSPAGVEVYRLDLAWPDQRVALEYNGYAVHAGREAEDDLRAEDLRRRGWLVIPVGSDDLSDSTRVEYQLRAAFERRGYRWPVC